MMAVPLPVFEVGPRRAIAGHVYGRRQPSLAVSIRARQPVVPAVYAVHAQQAVEALSRALRESVGVDWPAQAVATEQYTWADWITGLGGMAVQLLQAACLPAFDPAQTMRLASQGAEHEEWSTLLLPAAPGRPAATWQAWQLSLLAFAHAADPQRQRESAQRLQLGLRALSSMAPQGANTPRFLKAAYEQNIPVTAIGMEVFQYGQGRRAQWFDSTCTLQTSNSSVKLARNKQVAAARLCQAGLPVPSHQRVGSVEDALRAAQQLGYPVVVKPLDKDGGKGVTAGLDAEAELRTAFEQARAVSPQVLVEKHVQGRDYRLTVLDGELLWAIERIPAGVTGDGQRSIAQLIEQENQDPSRGDGAHAALKRLVLDDEARHTLSKQGYSETSVPVSGRFVALRRIANVASGGRPVAVNEQVHPDNARLAVSAAQALRLDLAGVDLLIPDIARSWRESGAAICEVNAQPQLGATTGPHLYGQILRKRLAGEGRIPVVVVVGASAEDSLMHEVITGLRAQGRSVGWSDQRGAGIDDELLVRGVNSAFASGQMLLTDPRVDALVLGLHDDELLSVGLPVDRIDCLVIAGAHLVRRQAKIEPGKPDTAKRLNDVLLAVLPACIGHVVHVRAMAVSLTGMQSLVPSTCSVREMERRTLLEMIEKEF